MLVKLPRSRCKQITSQTSWQASSARQRSRGLTCGHPVTIRHKSVALAKRRPQPPVPAGGMKGQVLF